MLSYINTEKREDIGKGRYRKMTTIKPERIEFNPQKDILDMMIGRNSRREQQPRHISYHCGLTAY
jgi:hypothetical protein